VAGIPNLYLAASVCLYDARRVTNAAQRIDTPESQSLVFLLRLRLHGAQPIVDVLSHLIFSPAVPLLKLSLKLIASAIDGGQVVISELTPLLFNLSAELFPVSCETIPIHSSLLR